MLTVAPIGSTKDEIRFDTPTLLSTASSVTGNVAPVELVEKAMAMELVELPNDVMGMVLNLEEDSVGTVLFGDTPADVDTIRVLDPETIEVQAPAGRIGPVAIASRAFAFYYMLQCLVAVTVCKSTFKRIGVVAIAIVLAFITIFAVPAG